MNCPDWHELGATRSSDESQWQDGLSHFDECALCRKQALMVDPLLVFRQLPEARLDENEIDDLRSRVAGARRVNELESWSKGPRWRGMVAASVLLGCLAVLGGGGSFDSTVPAAGDVLLAETSTVNLVSSQWSSASDEALFSATLSTESASLPLFEEIEPYQQVVQWSDETVSVVLVVDERFDV